MPKVGDMICSTPASVDLCQMDLPKAQEWHQLMLKQSQERCGSCGKSTHASIDVDTRFDVMKDVYVPGEFKRPHMSVNTVSMKQHENDYIRPNADLEMRPEIKSKAKTYISRIF